MSNTQTSSKVKIHKLPFIIKKQSLKSGPNSSIGVFRCLAGTSSNFIKEDVIYKAKNDDFFKGKYPNLLVMNRFNIMRNSSRTTATYGSENSSEISLSSDAVVNVIGQENYDQVLTALCSVISQELKVKGILSLLSVKSGATTKNGFNVETQTYESSYNEFIRDKQRRNRRKKIKSYVVKDHIKTSPKRIVIIPCNSELVKSEDIKIEVDEHVNSNIHGSLDSDINLITNETRENCTQTNSDNKGRNVNLTSLDSPKLSKSDDELFPNFCINDDTNISYVGSPENLSIGSGFSLSNLEDNASALINYIDEHIEASNNQHNESPEVTSSTSMVGSAVAKWGIPFHLATSNTLKHLMPDEQRQFILRQALIDWKFCLQRDEDENLPIHIAVLNNDLDLLKRQCIVLKSRNESVDVAASGNLTALQMSIFQDFPDCTSLLLEQGADLLVRDEELRTTLHLAAEIGSKNVEALLTHCRKNAREILREDEDLWNPELENKPHSKLAHYLITKLSTMCDNQGYTPLMLASKMGNFDAVRLLTQAAPSSINMAMPTCGSTALYLAVSAACIEASDRGDKTKVPENYEKTIEILVELGADPSIDNNYGSNVNMLLTEFNIVKLSLLIANKLTAIKYFDGDSSKNFGSYMLIKDREGKVNLTEMSKYKGARNKYAKPQNTNEQKLAEVKVENDDDNESILNNETIEKSNEVTKVVENIASTCSDIQKNILKKPVIIKNIPVVTKIVSFDKSDEKPIMVKGIVPNLGGSHDNKGLQTALTKNTSPKHAWKNNVDQTFSPLATKYTKISSKYLKILPKTSSTDENVSKILPQTDSNLKANIVKINQKTNSSQKHIAKKHPIILRNVAVKRTKSSSDSIPGSSKKSKS